MGDFSVLAIRIKELRASMKMTQKEFSTFVGCTAATLSAYENGSKSPSLEIIKGIAEKCHISIDWLCGLSDKQTNDDSIKTYADVIRLILKLLENKNLKTRIFTFPFENGAFWGFENSVLHKFFIDWEKIKTIYDQKVIDIDMYQPWLDSKLQELDIPIKKTQTNSMNYLIGRIFVDYEEEQKEKNSNKPPEK